MDLTAALTRHILFPGYLAWTRWRQLPQYRRVTRTQFWSEEEIRQLQWKSVQRLLRDVYARNRFYRRRFAEVGATPADIRTWEDFAGLPLLTKADLRETADELLSEGCDRARLLRKRTGGSTGVPVHVYWDRRAVQLKAGITMRHDAWAHFYVAARKAALWGDVQPRHTLWRKATGVLYDRTVYLDTLEMDERSMLAFVAAIRRTRTRLLFGHGHSLYHFARFVRGAGITDLRFDGIISTAEMLPPEERRVLEDVFGRVVYDRYGCEEVGLIASECAEHDGMHVAAEGVYVELLDGTPERPGRVVVTDLLNRATPVVRYEIGDLATTRSGACPCGRGLPRIGQVVGRTSDVLYAPDGRQVSGISLLDTVTIHIPGFKQVQVVQETLDELVFNVVRDDRYSEASLELLARAVEKHFGRAMRHKVVFVDAVPLTGRGKYQFSICKVAAPMTGGGGAA